MTTETLQLAGLVVSVIALVAAPVAYHFNKAIADLGAKLKDTALALADSTHEARTDLLERVQRLERWNESQVNADLEELRQRRLKAQNP